MEIATPRTIEAGKSEPKLADMIDTLKKDESDKACKSE